MDEDEAAEGYEDQGYETDNEGGGPDADETEENAYETTPDEATGFGRPGFFNRKKAMAVICITLAAAVFSGFIINLNNKNKKNSSAAAASESAARTPGELRGMMNRSINRALQDGEAKEGAEAVIEIPEITEERPLPAAVWGAANTTERPPRLCQNTK
jgi:hypothetical protein